MKFALVLSAFLLTLEIANAATVITKTVIIDFGAPLAGNAYGNQITGTSNNETISDLLEQGTSASTGWSLNVNGFRGEGAANIVFDSTLWNNTEEAFTSFSTSLGLQDKLDSSVWRDQALLASSGPTVFTVGNLVPGQEYTISFGLGRKTGSGTTNISVSTGDLSTSGSSWFSNNPASSGNSALTSLTFNSNGYIATYKVAADESGTIAFDFTSVGYGAVSFMTVTSTVVPEPASAVLALLGFAPLALRRRRA